MIIRNGNLNQMKIKNILVVSFAALLILLLSHCQKAPQKTEILLSNTSSINLTDKAISIERAQFSNLLGSTLYPLVLSSSGDTIPSQLNDLDGNSEWD